jgi:hypothetical protein
MFQALNEKAIRTTVQFCNQIQPLDNTIRNPKIINPVFF